MKIAVAILNWNGEKLLEKYLPSVVDHSLADAEVYVIDNGSTDNSKSVVAHSFPDVKWIALDNNYGFSEGYNKGIQHIEADWIVLLNSDVRVTAGWLGPLKQFVIENLGTKVLQPAILDDKSPNFYEYAGACGGYLDKWFYPLCRGRILDSFEGINPNYSDPSPIFWASGACCFIEKKTYQEVGGLDSDFFAHMEEIDLCWRVLNKYPSSIYVVPESNVYHYGGATLNSASPRKLFLNFRNSLFMIIKNHPRPWRILFIRMLLDGVAGIKFLVTLQFPYFFTVIKAHFSFYQRCRTMRKKRPKQFLFPKNVLYPKSMLVDYFLRGKRKFYELNWSPNTDKAKR